MNHLSVTTAWSAMLLLAGCATSRQAIPTSAATTAEVLASGETEAVGTANADAADDPAIWRNPRRPADSLIIGTDKKAGLYVYGLDGKRRDFVDAGRVNNVDLRDGVAVAGKPGILVAASDRNDVAHAKIALFRLDPTTAKLTSLGTVAAGDGEAYGICLTRVKGAAHAFVVMKDGTINQVALDLAAATPAGRIVRTMKLGTQSEGCAVDDRTAKLYVAEEDVGLWRFDARASGPVEPTSIAKVDGTRLVADAEGVAIAPMGRSGGYVLVSSQGDNAYAAWRLSDGGYAGRFRIAQGKFGSTEETDGIDLMLGNFGRDYPTGIFVAQDGHTPDGAQNFKLVRWDAIAKLIK
ncbi:phytase [Sphingomonas montanisoli]|uniref:Phytase n=1 Tax=Sphingomonas montanisoli TaxID=2606412 RepID=A0A5D9C7F7_9SPHN|nr:phytase [Sphingomonas montanisoli]TZG25931.1 phytase [Sphingomonas montanisoli]